MNDPRKPQRMGVTRKLTGLPPVTEQEKALEADGCVTIWTYTEYPQAIPSFMTDDVVVAVDKRAFGKHTGDFKTHVLNVVADKKKPGPKVKLPPIGSPEWAAIRYNWEKTQPKERHATGVARVMGYQVNDDQIRYQVNKENKLRILDPAAIDEGKE